MSAEPTTHPPLDAMTAGRLGQALRHAALQRTVEGLSRVVCDHVRDIVGADRSDCLFFDEDSQVLWRVDSGDDLPLIGVAGKVAQEGEPKLVADVTNEPVFNVDVDDPDGTAVGSRMYAPVLDGDVTVHAVLMVARSDGCFSLEEWSTFQLFARRMSIVFESVHLESIRNAAMHEAISSKADGLFDPAALAHHRAGKFGEVVELPPLLPPIALIIAGIALATLVVLASTARVNRYASGPAMVLSRSAVNIASPIDAILEGVHVRSGATVTMGQPLAQLNADKERYEVRLAETEFEQRLVRRLASPSDATLETAVADAKLELERARARERERVLVAPRDGVVDDIRLVAGQAVESGQTVISLGPIDSHLSLLTAIPASQRPALTVGQELRFEPSGYPFSFQRVIVKSVGTRVFGPSELRSVFGRDVGDTMVVDGPVVVVEAQMQGRSFVFDGTPYVFHPGMQGKADIRVADEPAIVVLFPFLKRFLS